MKNAAIVGCGDISGIYLKNFKERFGDRVHVVGLYDLVGEKARGRAAEYVVETVYGGLGELLADPAVDIVVNLTRPSEHCDVAKAALSAGKNVYGEKPLAAAFEQGAALVGLAEEKGLFIGCAPDTFLGAGLRTCRKVIDEGAIGAIVGATAFMTCRGHESWHPDPEFYYKRGGGPLFDMGPYYLTALVSLLGAVKSVAGMGRASFPTRTITSSAKRGTVVDVETPTHIAGLLEFKSGAICQIMTTFDVWAAELPRIEIYGAGGTLSCPDPNTFGGDVRLFTPETKAFEVVPLAFGNSENCRGLGVWNMVGAMERGEPFRASGRLALHVSEVMEGIYKSYETRGFVDMETDIVC